MILTLFAQLTYVNVVHWMVGLYYYGFLVNEGISLILVIHFIHLLLAYYIIRMATQPLLLYDPLLFLLIYLNHIRLHKILSYRTYSLYQRFLL